MGSLQMVNMVMCVRYVWGYVCAPVLRVVGSPFIDITFHTVGTNGRGVSSMLMTLLAGWCGMLDMRNV